MTISECLPLRSRGDARGRSGGGRGGGEGVQADGLKCR